VFALRGLDGLEVARSGDVRCFSQSHGALFVRQPCRRTIFAAQDGEVGGPPRFGVVGRV